MIFFESQEQRGVEPVLERHVKYPELPESLQLDHSDSYMGDFRYVLALERQAALQWSEHVHWDLCSSEQEVLQFLSVHFRKSLRDFAHGYVGITTSPSARWSGTWPEYHFGDGQVHRTKSVPHHLSYGRMDVIYTGTGQRIGMLEKRIIDLYISDIRMVNVSKGGETTQFDAPTWLYFCSNNFVDCHQFWRKNRLRMMSAMPRPRKRRMVQPSTVTGKHPFSFEQ